MKVLEVIRSQVSRRSLPLLLTIAIAAPTFGGAPQQLILSRDSRPDGEIKGVYDVVISPGFDDAKVSVTLDGQKVAESVLAPYHIQIDFGTAALEHKIVVMAVTSDRKKSQWQAILNKGRQPLTIKVEPSDFA